MSLDNLYHHADGDYYCLLSDDAALKNPAGEGHWLDAVVYTGTDGKMRATTKDRWNARFTPVAEYTGDDESVMMMIRRCNPGSTDFDFVRVFESWHESEVNITGAMLELAVGACLEHFDGSGGQRLLETDDSISITIKTEDLQRVLQTYDIERVPIPHGFTIRMSRPRPEAEKPEMISD
jgi:hypothetical protein